MSRRVPKEIISHAADAGSAADAGAVAAQVPTPVPAIEEEIPPTEMQIPADPAEVTIALPQPAPADMGESESWEQLYRQWRATDDPRLRERLILMHRKLVMHLARRFMDRGESFDDILQQGTIGLIQALDHFDPERGVRFSTFATPTIVGEIRRYFRDKTRGVRLPRRMQELHRNIGSQIEDLTQKLNRSPTYSEIALRLNASEEEVIEALEIGHIVDPLSLADTTFSSGDSPLTIAEYIGAPDPLIENYGDHEALQAALKQLPPAQQQALTYAYFEGYSQAEIARRMNVSQMHISRLLRRALARLRETLGEEA